MSTVVHIQVFADRLIATNMETGARAELSTHVYIGDDERPVRIAEPDDGTPVLLSVKAARAGHVVNGFGHPRVAVGDFHAAEYVVRRAVDAVWTSKLPRWLRRLLGFSSSAPRLLFQLRRDMESPLTAVELRALL